MNIRDPFRRFIFTLLGFALFPWKNVMQLSKQSLVRCRGFHGYHCPDGNTHIKNNRSFKKYLNFTLTIHINPNPYSFRIMFIMIIVRFFYICFINGWKYEKLATNWDRVTNRCVYLIKFPSRTEYRLRNLTLSYLNEPPKLHFWRGCWTKYFDCIFIKVLIASLNQFPVFINFLFFPEFVIYFVPLLIFYIILNRFFLFSYQIFLDFFSLNCNKTMIIYGANF